MIFTRRVIVRPGIPHPGGQDSDPLSGGGYAAGRDFSRKCDDLERGTSMNATFSRVDVVSQP